MKGIGEKIRKIRNLRGYSQEYMGARLKMSQNNYSRIELDQINLTLNTLTEIAQVLEIGVQEIMSFNETTLFRTSVVEEPDRNEGKYKVQQPILSMLQEEIVSLREDKRRLMSLLERQQGSSGNFQR
ncbi:MAG: helix-turn-helix domain-containing protein [Cyclobacteriaceae bacterium]|jgi:transcriptional regulator with XRE-family HTH domain